MLSAIIMAIIGGFFCTTIFNWFFIKRFCIGVRNCFVTTPPAKEGENKAQPAKKFDFMFNSSGIFLVHQLIFFLIGFAILLAWFYLGTVDRTISQLIATAWFVGVMHFLNLIWISDNKYIFRGCRYGTPEEFDTSAFIFSVGIFVISLLFNIAGGVYNFSHQYDSTTFLQENSIPVVSTDVMKSLEHEMVIDGYQLSNAINRDGQLIMPMSREGNVSYVGYVVIENDQPTIVLKDLRYTPYHKSTNHPDYVARNNMPTKIFFGDWSFQLSPDGDVYFIRMYGHHTFLRGGRAIEGLAFVNSETGEFSWCNLEDAPSWISGLSQ